jgi:hypothetical protein
VDQGRVPGSDLAQSELEPSAVVDAEVLDQDVGAVAELAEATPVGAAPEIEAGAALVGIPIEEWKRAIGRFPAARERRPKPVGITSRRLDLQDVGAEVGEDPSGQSTPQIGEIDDSEVCERTRHAALLLSAGESGKRRIGRPEPGTKNEQAGAQIR